MKKIPPKLLAEMLTDPYYKKCARKKDGECDGRITLEHSIIFAGSQLSEKWSIIPLCTYHHSVDFHQDGKGLNKEKNIWIALNRATDFELEAISKAIDYKRYRDYLNKRYK